MAEDAERDRCQSSRIMRAEQVLAERPERSTVTSISTSPAGGRR
ncbi:MAG: hypothetical protein U0R24_15930 [Solirubrobacterales bacterium]